MEETSLPKPSSMEELLYFTRRTIKDGRTVAWVFKVDCPECGDGVLQKPRKDDGGVKTRSPYWNCSNCDYETKDDVDEGLDVNIHYICPHCGFEGDAQTEYERRTYYGEDAIVFQCRDCYQEIPISKKIKRYDELKTKKNPSPPE